MPMVIGLVGRRFPAAARGRYAGRRMVRTVSRNVAWHIARKRLANRQFLDVLQKFMCGFLAPMRIFLFSSIT
jgi:hypothetical protein